MNFLHAQQLLIKVANASLKEKEAISKEKILKCLNEVKYLSSQKKIPKITLRKEIIHLENHLQSVFELEEILIKNKGKETVKVTSLKRQIAGMKKKLAAVEDKELHHKVEKLSHLLGDRLAKKETHASVGMVRRAPAQPTPSQVSSQAQTQGFQAQTLKHRIDALKQELQLAKDLEKDIPKDKIKLIEQAIVALEAKFAAYQQGKPIPVETQPVKHVMLFDKAPEKLAEVTRLAPQMGPPVIKDKPDLKPLQGPGVAPAAQSPPMVRPPLPMPVTPNKVAPVQAPAVQIPPSQQLPTLTPPPGMSAPPVIQDKTRDKHLHLFGRKEKLPLPTPPKT